MILSRSFKSKVEPTENVLHMAHMFGIGVDEEHEIVLYEDLEVTPEVGKIVYITGESGGGKSCLLRDIKQRESGAISDKLCQLFEDEPLVDQFNNLKQAAELMNIAGISEPFVMMRKPPELSDGQRYRFMLAKLLWRARESTDGRVPSSTATRFSAAGFPIIFIDEFLAFLDRVTAKAIACNVRKMANRENVGFVVATTHQDIAEDLQADVTINMALGKQPRFT